MFAITNHSNLNLSCVCTVVGGEKLDCEINVGASSTNLVEFKLLLNSGARFIGCGIKDVFLVSQRNKSKYLKVKY